MVTMPGPVPEGFLALAEGEGISLKGFPGKLKRVVKEYLAGERKAKIVYRQAFKFTSRSTSYKVIVKSGELMIVFKSTINEGRGFDDYY